MSETKTLGYALPELMAKVRDETLPIYEEIAKESPLTILSIAAIKAELDAATRALAEGNVLDMIASYSALKKIYES